MTPEQLRARTKKYAVDVIRFAKGIPKDHINDEMALQLTRVFVRSRETARRNRDKAISKNSSIANRKSPTSH
jgi:hypothetical protein